MEIEEDEEEIEEDEEEIALCVVSLKAKAVLVNGVIRVEEDEEEIDPVIGRACVLEPLKLLGMENCRVLKRVKDEFFSGEGEKGFACLGGFRNLRGVSDEGIDDDYVEGREDDHCNIFGLLKVQNSSFRPSSDNFVSSTTPGRHPVLDSILQDSFVPNDTNLNANEEYCQIITGPNMGGKSCYIHQVALIAIMAQVGSFVPASATKLHVLDGVHTRLGSSDSIQQGRSTFLEELSEASHIIHNCTPRSLIILDELGRGTSTHDGVAIPYATLQHLLKRIRCMVLFVTHYPKIVEVKNEFPGDVGAYHVSYLATRNTCEIAADSESDKSVNYSDQNEITFLYKLVPGIQCL